MKIIKPVSLVLFLQLLFIHHCFSQDILIKKSNEGIEVLITEITDTEVRFRKFDEPRGPIYSYFIYELKMIKYENGRVVKFDGENESTVIESRRADLFGISQIDASRHYRKYSGASTGTLVVSLISPIIGLIPAIATSTTMPKDENLGYPDPSLMKKTEYYNGYTKKAKKVKSNKVWTNWGIAFGINLIAVIVLTSNQN